MKDFKSVQDLIIKAALYDGISTTISAYEHDALPYIGDAVRITFSRGNMHTSTYIELTDAHRDLEEVALYGCKHALYNLLRAPYEEITYERENKS